MSWQPISTAPKIGRGGPQVLLYTHSGVRVGIWHGQQWVLLPGKYGSSPSHWMPLPEPPEGS